ncbi:peptidase S8/S53 domain-containing protein [Lactarius pseudohatsudake]|nr:peptidase S8/S53 domain-containing protein [Lactarius pseudohatsudake]
MRYHALAVLSILSAAPFADLATSPLPLWGDISVKHTWNTVPPNWETLGPPPLGTTIDLYIALQPRRDSALIDALHEVSTPGHPKYGAHLSKEQVAELIAPRQDTLKLVHSWLEHHRVPSSSISTSHGGSWLTITGVPVSQADELLSASYQLYRHTGENATEVILRTVSYSLPAVLHGHVQTVAPTTYFVPPRRLPQTSRKYPSEEGAATVVNATPREPVSLPTASEVVTPSTVRWLYGTEAYEPLAEGYNALGILGLNDEYPSYTDLTQFMTEFRADAVDATFAVQQVNGGGFNPNQPSSEANVDTQWTGVIAHPIPHIFYSTGGLLQIANGQPASNDAYLVWFNYLLGQEDIPPTISISYSNPETIFPLEYASSLCNLFAQLGLRGVSVLASSGDDGVGRGDCRDNSGSVRFTPSFPSSCPWVTSVGGTERHDPEVGMYMSGGGFSMHFTRPNYQEGLVAPFLGSLGSQYAGLYDPRGRGIPDISAQANWCVYIRLASLRAVSGTSASAPIVAGIVSLLNDYLISTGRPRLGFLNLLLYGHGRDGVNDITSGSNPGCGTDGFTAIPGWDPQYTSAIAYPTTHIFYSADSSDTGDPFINWLDYVLGQLSVTQTVSTAYSTPEYTVPPDYATHACNLFARLGARGASVLFSSGNDGVGRGNCLVKDSSGNSRVQFLPTFPSTCPWVTGFGETTGYNPEVAASLSRGGFSAYFPRPPYQNNAVPTSLLNLGGYPGGRGISDISLQAMDFPIVFTNKVWRVSGTSCSTPTAAGIISLLNDYRISNGRSPLGFLNVLLYGICLRGLNDITSGSNPGCNTDGFSAVPGWDPVTGLG